MLDAGSLKDLLHQPDFSNIEKVLLCLAVDDTRAKSVSEIKRLAIDAGLREAKRWNISQYLSSAKRMAISTREGWEITNEGRRRVSTLAGAIVNTPVPLVAASLRSQLAQITDADTIAFLDEAIQCYERKLYRAAVVLSWVGALSVLYEYVLANRLVDFNAEATKRDPKWRAATTKDDLARMKEHEFLQVLAALSIIGKSVKDELEACLKLRNGCGHPNSLKVGEHKVTAHIETLILNVFSQF